MNARARLGERATIKQHTSEEQDAAEVLFGNQDRLIVAAAIDEAEVGLLYGQALAELTGISEARVGSQLGHFVDAGLLSRLPKVGGGRRVYYHRSPSAYWKLCRAFRDEVVERVGTSSRAPF